MRYLARLLIIIASLVCCADNARSQVSTAVVNFNFATLVQTPNRIQWLSLQTVPSVLNGTNYQGQIFTSVAQNPSLTNGFFSTNVVCGLIISGTWSDGYNTYTTNFYFPSSIAGGSVSAWQYVGLYNNQIPAFFYANQPSPLAAGNSGIGVTNIGGTNFLYNLTVGGGATNALINGPGGVYDASLVTNVLGSHVVGAVANASAVNGTVTATGGNVVTNFGLAGTLSQQSDYSGSPWGQNESQRHPQFFYFAPYPRHQAGSPDATEFQVTNYFNSLASSGQLASITNAGYYPVFFLDIGWEARRNFNPNFMVTNLGTLDWDTNMFPDGMPWLIQKLRTNGIGTLLSLYGVGTPAYTIAPTESGWTITWTGTSPLPYTNGVGPGGFVYTNSSTPGFKSCELSGPDMLRWDVNELRWWGCWGFGMNDVNQQPDNIVATERIVADARNRFFAPPGFNQSSGCSYWNQNLAAINWSQATNGWTATNTTAIYANWIENPPDYISTPQIEFWPYETTTQPGVYGDITRQFHNGVSFENFASPSNGRAFTNITFCWPSTHRTSEGAWWPSAADTSGVALPAAAFDSACWDIDAYTNTTMTSLIVYFQNATYLSFLTNAFMDGLSAIPKMVYDQGVGQGTVWKKPLSNGDTLIWFSNEATNGWYPSITWNQLGFNTNDWYAVTGSQIFGPASSWLPCTNKIGMFTNVLLNSGAQFFIRLSKQPDASQLLGTVPTAQLTGNNITNATGFFFPPGGGSSFVNGSANGTSQTNMNQYVGTYNGSGGTNTFTPTTNQFVFAGPAGTAGISNATYYGLATALTNASGHTLLGTTDSGSGLTSLNASQLTSGTVSLGLLPTPVATNGGSITVGTAVHPGSISYINPVQDGPAQYSTNNGLDGLQFVLPTATSSFDFDVDGAHGTGGIKLYSPANPGIYYIGNAGGLTNLSASAVTAAQNSALPPGVSQFYDASFNSIYSNSVTHDINYFATNFSTLSTGSEVKSNASISIVGTGQYNGNGSGLTGVNAANVSGIWAAPVVTNFAGSVTFSNLNVPNTTTTLALLPSQVPNATQVTNMIAANASGGSSANAVITNGTTQIVATVLQLTNTANIIAGTHSGNGVGLTNVTAIQLSILVNDLYAGGNNANGAEIVVTNGSSVSWAGTTVQSDDGSFAVPTNYAGMYKNNSAYQYAAGSIGTTNSGIVENNGDNLYFDTIGPAPHFYFGTRLTFGTSFATNELDLSASGASFLVPINGLAGPNFTNASGQTPVFGSGGSVPNGLVTNNVLGIYTNVPEAGVADFKTPGNLQAGWTNFVSSPAGTFPYSTINTNGTTIIDGNETNNANFTVNGSSSLNTTTISLLICSTLRSALFNINNASGVGGMGQILVSNIFCTGIVLATNGIATYGNHIPNAVSVGASPFTFQNPTGNPNLHYHITDSAAYSLTFNGVSVVSSFTGPYADSLEVTDVLVITYLSTAPTLYTNQ